MSQHLPQLCCITNHPKHLSIALKQLSPILTHVVLDQLEARRCRLASAWFGSILQILDWPHISHTIFEERARACSSHGNGWSIKGEQKHYFSSLVKAQIMWLSPTSTKRGSRLTCRERTLEVTEQGRSLGKEEQLGRMTQPTTFLWLFRPVCFSTENLCKLVLFLNESNEYTIWVKTVPHINVTLISSMRISQARSMRNSVRKVANTDTCWCYHVLRSD